MTHKHIHTSDNDTNLRSWHIHTSDHDTYIPQIMTHTNLWPWHKQTSDHDTYIPQFLTHTSDHDTNIPLTMTQTNLRSWHKHTSDNDTYTPLTVIFSRVFVVVGFLPQVLSQRLSKSHQVILMGIDLAWNVNFPRFWSSNHNSNLLASSNSSFSNVLGSCQGDRRVRCLIGKMAKKENENKTT